MDPDFVPTPRIPQAAGPAAAQRYLSLRHLRPRQDVDVCEASGEIDLYTLPLLHGALHEIEARDRPWLFVDLSHVTFLGVAGARELNMAGTRARARHQRLELIVPARAVRRALTLTGLDIGLPTYERLSDGLAELPDMAENSQP